MARTRTKKYSVVNTNYEPYRLEDGVACIVGAISTGSGMPSLQFNCPCGCGERITLGHASKLSKHTFEFHPERGLSVFPSLRQVTACRSHFYIANGKVIWCNANGVLNPKSFIR